MCGIIGFFNFKNAENMTKNGLELIKYRGQDGFGFQGSADCYTGHCLHAIVSKVKQPLFDKEFVFSTNCEIYNWKKLSKSDRNDAETLFNLLKNSKDIDETLKLVEGVYAFSLWNKKENLLILARDIIGVKPLWYYYDAVTGEFAYSSERKALLKQGLERAYIFELNPRKILVYDIKTKELKEIERDFFSVNVSKEKDETIILKTQDLILEAIKKRIPENKKIGLLFSGGIDSTFIALTLKKLNVPFTCYTAALTEPGLTEASDLEWSKKVAKELDLDLKILTVSLQEVPEYLKTILPLIEDNNVVKAGVALPFFLCSKEAKKDGVKVLFSGLGSEEIFAGYERHKKSLDINEECLSGLLKIYERDLYRDDCITMYHTIELRLPFLDKKLAEYALTIPEHLKLNSENSKLILRMIAKKQGLNLEFSDRKKKAAQYGSNFDKALEKLSKKEKKNKSSYLKQFYNEGNVRLGALISTGKDSLLAVQIMKEQNYDIACFITIESDNQDSYMYHGPNTNLASLQAKATGVPLITQKSLGEKEIELDDLKKAIKKAVIEHKIEGIVNGALFSNYQRKRIEKICDELGIKCFSPLWHMDQTKEVELLLSKGFEFILVKVAAEGLDKSWLGKIIGYSELEKLKELNRKIGFHVALEGGEAESLVLDCPMFRKKIIIKKSKIVMENECTGTLIIEKAELE